MLTFFPPSEELLPALEDYLDECRRAGDSLDGTAGMGNFASLRSWLERIRLLASPDAERRGWFRTEVFLAARMPEVCSLTAKAQASGVFRPRIVGTGNVRFTHDERAERLSGHIGYHVRPSERKKGFGSSILAHAAARCAEEGLLRPAVCVEADNLPSLRTALCCGFVPEDRIVLPTGEDAVLLRLPSGEDRTDV